MITKMEINNCVSNIKHFTEKIDKLAKRQLQIDLEKHPENTARLNFLGAMGVSTRGIEMFCMQLDSLVIAAEKAPVEEETPF